MANFYSHIGVLLGHEGGFVDHPLDSGGPTNMGITLATYRRIKPSASVEDLRNLSVEEAGKIYKTHYWDALKLDRVNNQNLANSLMDFGVNAGTKRSAKLLQFALNQNFGAQLAVDGIIGEATLQKVNAVDGEALAKLFDSYRAMYYKFLANVPQLLDSKLTQFFSQELRVKPQSSQKVFLRGWLARLKNLGRNGKELVSVAGVVLVAGLFFFLIRKQNKNGRTRNKTSG